MARDTKQIFRHHLQTTEEKIGSMKLIIVGAGATGFWEEPVKGQQLRCMAKNGMAGYHWRELELSRFKDGIQNCIG